MENVNLVMPDEQDDFYEHHRIQVDRGQSLIRIDKFLFGKLGNVSRNKIQMAAKSGNILVNNKQEKSNYKVKPGDVISVLLPGPVKEFEIIAENIPINIVYEDDDIIVINKDAGMVVHPGHGNYTGTLINALAFYFQDNPDVLPALIHRIDKDTSGILLVGKKRISTNYTC